MFWGFKSNVIISLSLIESKSSFAIRVNSFAMTFGLRSSIVKVHMLFLLILFGILIRFLTFFAFVLLNKLSVGLKEIIIIHLCGIIKNTTFNKLKTKKLRKKFTCREEMLLCTCIFTIISPDFERRTLFYNSLIFFWGSNHFQSAFVFIILFRIEFVYCPNSSSIKTFTPVLNGLNRS